MIHRTIETQLAKLAKQFPVITITGPRQSGKTTLAQHFFASHEYINLEEPEFRRYAEEDPKGFLADHPAPVILDEIQRVPELLSYIQILADRSPEPGRFVLTGSHQPALKAGISQSLAGRTAILQLLPLSIAELRDAGIVLDRAQAYIGVLIDDLVTKENFEPYRMMTSRAEYRLLLRQDNADIRLTRLGYAIGLISEERYQRFKAYEKTVNDEIARVEKTFVKMTDALQEMLSENGTAELKGGASLADLIRRPELSYELLAPVDPGRPEISERAAEQVNIAVKYAGYIERQQRQVESFRKMENRRIPEDIDYSKVPSLRIEARQKLEMIRPTSLGQASRIAGVSPADIQVLLVWLKK